MLFEVRDAPADMAFLDALLPDGTSAQLSACEPDCELIYPAAAGGPPSEVPNPATDHSRQDRRREESCLRQQC